MGREVLLALMSGSVGALVVFLIGFARDLWRDAVRDDKNVKRWPDWYTSRFCTTSRY